MGFTKSQKFSRRWLQTVARIQKLKQVFVRETASVWTMPYRETELLLHGPIAMAKTENHLDYYYGSRPFYDLTFYHNHLNVVSIRESISMIGTDFSSQEVPFVFIEVNGSANADPLTPAFLNVKSAALNKC